MGPILLTGADRRFFDLAQGTIRSIRDKHHGQDISLGFLDLGCTEEQRAWVRSHGAQIVVPQWEFDFPNQANTPNYLKGRLAQPFFRKYFPGYELYLWIDAEVWLQDWEAIELFWAGARRRKGLAIVPEIHGPNDVVSLAGALPTALEHSRQLYREAFDEATANLYHAYPLLSMEAFCLHQEAPHWEPWAQYLQIGIQKSCTKTIAALALHRTVFEGTVPPEIALPPVVTETYLCTEFLPGRCLLAAEEPSPAWDEVQHAFVEKYPPYGKLGVLRHSVTDALPRDRGTVPTIQGQTLAVRLEYAPSSNPILITGADRRFFDLVQGTIRSIRDKPQGRDIALGFLDLGCTEEQRAWVRSHGAQVVVPQWEFDFPNQENTPSYLRGLLARPFFRKYFPGYELYLWIDADAWVQDWAAIELFLAGARRRKGLAIVPEIHGPNDFVSLAGKIPAVLGWGRQLYREVFDEATANLYHIYPILNAGVFCLHREAPHWEPWAEYLQTAAQKAVSVMTDQMALHCTVFAGTVPAAIQLPPIITEIYLRTEFLPGWCNFLIGSHLPTWDETRKAFVERYLPHQKLGIVHNTGPDKLQRNRVTVPTVQGTAMAVSLYYMPPASPSASEVIIVTGADSKYFEMVRGTILSIRDKPQGRDIPLGFLDLGCTEEQLAWVRSHGAQVVVPQWEFDFPNQANTPSYLRGFLVRPFFRKYFPGYELYLWIDADAWVQDWEAIELFCRGARERKGLAIVAELHGANDFFTLTGKIPFFLGMVHHTYVEVLGEDVADRQAGFPFLNAGVFCLHRDAPHWEPWGSQLQQAAQKAVTVMTDQVVLHSLLFGQSVPRHINEPAATDPLYLQTEFLPGWCNFLVVTRLPTWDKTQRCFVERYLPRHRIGILHNAGSPKAPNAPVLVPTVDDGTAMVRLYYPAEPAPIEAGRTEVIIITGADSKYFDLVQGTILSIRDKPQGRDIPLGFLDLGCTEEQLAWVRSHGAQIVIPQWEFDFPNQENTPNYLKGLLARPFFRKYFPEYELYLWIDADAWVQDWAAIELFCQGARERKGLAIVGEIQGANDFFTFTGKIPFFLMFGRRLYAEGLDEEVADRLYQFPLLNAGVFCLHHEAPHWEVWAENLYQAAQKEVTVMTDQTALHYTVFAKVVPSHLGDFPSADPVYARTEFLPGWCNTLAVLGQFPTWDEKRQCFVERYLPRHKIGILHIVGTPKVPNEAVQVPTVDGGTTMVRLYYPQPSPEPTPEITSEAILITGADSKYFDLVQGTILSIRDKPQGRDIPLGFLDLGCTEEQLAWVRSHGAQIVVPQWEFDFPNQENTPNYLKGLLARPFFRKYFPGYELYLWIDADAWVQDWAAIELFCQGARERKGLAIVAELHGANDFFTLTGKIPFFLNFGRHVYAEVFDEAIAERNHVFPLLNAGVFCLHHQAPHWEAWADNLWQVAQKAVTVMTDQMALHYTIFAKAVPQHINEPAATDLLYTQTEFLPGWCNFLVAGRLPTWDKAQQCFVERYLPRHKIGILHNAGSQKVPNRPVMVPTICGETAAVSLYYPVPPDRRTSGLGLSTQEKIMDETTKLAVTVRPSGRANLPKGDYIAPGFQTIFPDRAFPHKIVGDPQKCAWEYLRREIPHNWYVDQRHPYIGFLSRDEAHILYNNALQFRGKPALEVGCWMGWSAVHLALAGVHLDIIDPILEKPEARQSVESSLESARQEFPEFGSYVLHPGFSPQKVDELAQAGKIWSLIFIDGNHDRPAPLEDAQACVKYAAPDAMILFHDLASPEVTEGLDYLRCHGWNVMVYQTMQIMGVAWRGNVQPVRHVPDPTVTWNVPAHLRPYPICGTPEELEFRQLAAQVQPYTLLQDCRLYSLYRLTRELCEQDRPGNIVECGSYKGGAAALMAAVVKRYSRRSRRVFACDTFTGMPEPTALDRHRGIGAVATGFGAGTLAAPMTENLSKICEVLGVTDVVTPVPGLFAETLPTFKSEMGAIALLHADGDWYESTRDIFQNLYAAVVAGGAIQIDDYGHWEGCRQAVEEFAAAQGETWDLQPIDYTGVYFYKPQGRDFRSALRPPLLHSIQQASLQYSYRGVRMVKNPFDFALYPLLLWQVKPKTLIEVGSFSGGSALWFGDLMTTYGLEGRVYSVDIHLVTTVSHPKVTFLQGDQTQLEKVFGPEFWATVERPLLVIEDGAHFYETSKAVLDFFGPHLQPGEYIVIEDGIVDDLGETDAYRGGPNRAIREFLAEWGQYYEIDTAFCDFFGPNVTWNTNGYLRKVGVTPGLAEQLGLRQFNFVIFPDWSQFEEALYEQLQGVWRAILSHPRCGDIALLIGTIGESPEACDEMVSGAAMELLALEDFDFDGEPQVIFAHHLTATQWQELRPRLTARIAMESELVPPAPLQTLAVAGDPLPV